MSRSSDGLTWQNPASVDPSAPSSDKNWIVCDSWASSPHFGNCYLEWDDPINQGEIQMSTSTDGGLTWGIPVATADLAQGIGGQPLVQPNGNVVVPIETNVISAFSSSDGGISWSAPVTISTRQFHTAALRGSGWCWNRLGGVGGLPVPGHVRDERSGLQHVDRWRELERGYSRTNR